VICAVYVQLRAEPRSSEPFAGSVSARQWSEVTISRVDAGAQTVFHPESDQTDACLVSVQIAGTGIVSQAGRDAVLSPGDFSLYDASRPYQLSFDDSFSQIVVQFPRGLLIDRGVDLERAVAQRSIAGMGLTNVATSLVASLDTQNTSLPAEVQSRLGQQVVDLFAGAMTVQGLGRTSTDAAGPARRSLVSQHVLENLSDPDLTVASVAAALGFGTRTLQLVFAPGPSLRSEIRRLRLERASDALANPLLAHQSISRIGADHGFGDPSAFARAFKRHFGASPSQHRARTSPVGHQVDASKSV